MYHDTWLKSREGQEEGGSKRKNTQKSNKIRPYKKKFRIIPGSLSLQMYDFIFE